VLLAAQREHEERKLRFMGNLIANLAFHPEIDRGYANYLIRLAEKLSFHSSTGGLLQPGHCPREGVPPGLPQCLLKGGNLEPTPHRGFRDTDCRGGFFNRRVFQQGQDFPKGFPPRMLTNSCRISRSRWAESSTVRQTKWLHRGNGRGPARALGGRNGQHYARHH
jgi:hypothetical protein